MTVEIPNPLSAYFLVLCGLIHGHLPRRYHPRSLTSPLVHSTMSSLGTSLTRTWKCSSALTLWMEVQFLNHWTLSHAAASSFRRCSSESGSVRPGDDE